MTDTSDFEAYLVLGGLILILVLHVLVCLGGFVAGVLGAREAPVDTCEDNSFRAACLVGYSCGRPLGFVTCLLPTAVCMGAREAMGFAQAWVASVESAQVAQQHLVRSAKIMLVGSALSLLCMLVAFASPWAVVENPEEGSKAYFWPYVAIVTTRNALHGDAVDREPDISKAFKALFPDQYTDEVGQAIGSIVMVSKTASAVLALSLITQCLAFVATTRTWAMANGWRASTRGFAREASMNLNAFTFLMTIFCASTYSTAFQYAIDSLANEGSTSVVLLPGLGFTFAASGFSFLSLALVAAPCFRKAWRGNVAEAGATAPLLATAPIPPPPTPLPPSSTSGLEKTLPRHLERQLLEAAEGMDTECPICLDKITTASGTYTKCGHLFCKECVETLKKDRARCPTCRGAL